MSVGINPAKVYSHPTMGDAIGKWVPLLTSAGNFYWHIAKTSPASFDTLKARYAALQAKRKAGEYLQADLSGGAREALANVLLTLLPPPNAAQWLADRLAEYESAGAVFVGADPRFALSDWTAKTQPAAVSGGVEPGAPEQAGIGAKEIGIGLLIAAGVAWAVKSRSAR